MSEIVEQATEQSIEVPGFLVNLIGRLVAENEALKAGLIPAAPEAAAVKTGAGVTLAQDLMLPA